MDFASDYPPGSQRTPQILPCKNLLWATFGPLCCSSGSGNLRRSHRLRQCCKSSSSLRFRKTAIDIDAAGPGSKPAANNSTDSVSLSLVAGVASILTAESFLRFLLRFVPFSIPRQSEIGIDWVVLGFATLVSFVTGLTFGLAPAIQSTKPTTLSPFGKEPVAPVTAPRPTAYAACSLFPSWPLSWCS
jgi:hypothetical protein